MNENDVTNIETVQITTDSLMRVLAGMSGGNMDYIYVALPPYEEETQIIEMFRRQEETTRYPVIDPERLIDRSGHEPVLHDSTTMVHISGGGIDYHDVDIEVIREHDDRFYFTEPER